MAPGCSAPRLTNAARVAVGNVGRGEETALSPNKETAKADHRRAPLPLVAPPRSFTNNRASDGSAFMSESGSVLVSAEARGGAKAAQPRLLLLSFYPNDYGIL